MKRFSVWAMLMSGLLGLSAVAVRADDQPKKLDANQAEELFKKLDKNEDGKIVPDELADDQGRFFDRLVRLGDKDDNGELTKEEFLAAIEKGDAPVRGGSLERGPSGSDGRGFPSPKEMIERLDKNKDGKLTKDELPEEGPGRFLRQMLERSGKESLTADDIEKGRQAFAGSGRPGGGDPGQFLKTLDKNNDGKIQKEELPEGMRERFARLFEKSAKNELAIDELAKAIREFGPPQGPGGRPNPDEMFARLDTNKDGKITLEEVPEPLRDRVRPMFERAKKEALSLDDVTDFMAQAGDRRAPEGRRPEGDRAGDDDRSRDGERREGDRAREGDKPREGDRRRDGDRAPESRGRDANRQPRDGDRRPDGDGPGRRPQLPRFFELLDKNHDGRISKEELDRLRDVFGELDLNKDGQLDPAELLGPPPGDRGPEGRGPGDRGPDGRNPDGRPRREADRSPEGRNRPEGDRPPEGRRREGEGERRRPDADKPREEEKKRDKPRDEEKKG